jgi:peptide-methionine (S)-S-oxide reductase
MNPVTPQRELATFGAGCFWCVEAVYEQLRGVHKVISGYSGGHVENPTYQQVCADATGHAEVVQITFDPETISFADLLDVLFAIHDPTAKNYLEIKTQYRSVIFYHSPEQQRLARDKIAEVDASGLWSKPVVTQVVPFKKFYPAEDYHQRYYRRNPSLVYCQTMISPKVAKITQVFHEKLKV